MSELGRQLNFQTMVPCALFKSQNWRSAVDVTLYKMSAKTSVCGEGALEIYRHVGPQYFQIGTINCFLKEIESEPITALRRYCQTTPIHGHAVPGTYFFCDTRRGNL